MKNLIKTTAIALTLTATSASAASIMLGTAMDGVVITQTDLFPIETNCTQAVQYANKSFSNITGQRINMTYHSREGQFKRYTDKVAGIDYMAICIED
jgi:hypothetical protein